jgi:hypothetical protein
MVVNRKPGDERDWAEIRACATTIFVVLETNQPTSG